MGALTLVCGLELALHPAPVRCQATPTPVPDLSGLASRLQPSGQLEVAAGQLGVSAAELEKLKAAAAGGGTLTPDQAEQLAARLGAKNLSAPEIDAIARELGLNPDQIAQVKAHLPQPNAKSTPAESGAPAAASAAAAAAVSSIEQNFRTLDSERPPEIPSPDKLSQFGYSLFASGVSTFAPVGNVPVSKDYVLGPGDELKILFWGRVNRTYQLPIERDGSILVPEIGPIDVAGLSFGQAKELIENRTGQITGVQTDVTMGQLRTIGVFVVGEVAQPGAYTVSALSTISNALVAAGGVTKVGGLRRIQLRRGNQAVRTLDLYDVLLRGDTSADVRLEPRDVIFVPVIGPVAGITGAVKRPAIYELGGPQSLTRLIDLAGGISAFGYRQRVQVERVENHTRRTALDVSLGELRAQRFEVHDGDLVRVFPVLPERNEVVSLAGNVHRPGRFQWHPGMRVTDLLGEGEGVADHTFFKYALIRRIAGADRRVRFIPVDLGEALAGMAGGPADFELHPRDQLIIYSQEEMLDTPAVTVEGEVRKPGPYQLSRGMRVSDLVYLAGGLKQQAYQVRAELARTQVVEGAATRRSYIDVDLRAALSGSESNDPLLEENDQLLVITAPGWHPPWTVKVEGQVLRPGPYTLRRNERLASVLMRCGGMLPDAYLPGTVFLRNSIKETQQARLEESKARIAQSITQLQLRGLQSGGALNSAANTAQASPEALNFLQSMLAQAEKTQALGRLVVHLSALQSLAASPSNVMLEDGDRVVIPRRPSSVNVLGQVYNPTAIVREAWLTVEDYLQRAGGVTELADPDNIYVIKADGSIISRQGFSQSGRGRPFPLLPLVSGGLMTVYLDVGDTIYVPEKLIYVNKLEVAKDVATVIGQTVSSLGVLGLLVTR